MMNETDKNETCVYLFPSGFGYCKKIKHNIDNGFAAERHCKHCHYYKHYNDTVGEKVIRKTMTCFEWIIKKVIKREQERLR